MAIQLLPTSWVGPVTTRAGDVGPNVFKLLIGYGFWSPSGKILTFPRSMSAQNNNPHFGPVPMPDNYEKGTCCDCGGSTSLQV